MRPRVIACEVKLVYRLFLTVLILIGVLAVASMSFAEQVPDDSYEPDIENPAYTSGEGPVVMVDEGHFNFHTIGYRYRPFAKLLRRDGYTVEPLPSEFREDSLSACEILVISNALSERNQNDWCLPTPSAFSDEEIAAVRNWVKNGGSLLLIADHMPFPGCAEKLGAAFGLRFNNGFALETDQGRIIGEGWLTFSRSDGSLANHAITHGRSISEGVDSVMSFTGQAFQSDVNVRPLLTIGADVVSFMPECAWEFHDTTPKIPVEGWLQGAVLSLGSGRIAVFGEAAMFSAQIKGDGRLMGMNAPGAEQNFQFVLNVMHWLSGLLDTEVPGDYPTIQLAIDAATSGDRILVDPGVYVGGIDFGGKNLIIQSTKGPGVTTIDGNGGKGVIIGPQGALIGFSITNSIASFGAGMEVIGTGTIISNNIFDGNIQEGDGSGAAIGGNSASPTIEQNVFRNNTCDNKGLSGVISFVNSSSPRIINNIIENNPCRAINMTLPVGNQPEVINNTIVNNYTGVRVDRGINTSGQIYRNNIIVGNEIGLEVDFGTEAYNPTWENNLVFDNDIDYEGISDQTGLNGNISEDPLFHVNYIVGDEVVPDVTYRLRSDSPCIDAGTSQNAPNDDIDGDPRPWGAGVDIGADEHIPPVDYWTPDRMRDAVPPDMGIVVPEPPAAAVLFEDASLGFTQGGDSPLITD